MWDLVEDFEAKIVQGIVRHVNEDKNVGHIPQPMFIVGSSGAGKSTILRMLQDNLKGNGYCGMVQIFDGKQFFCSRDIIRSIDNDDYDGSRTLCRDFNEQRAIVMIDDLDYYFKRSALDGQYLLRNYLNHDFAPLLIGTLADISESLTDYRAPFFEGVRLVYIPPFEKSMLEGTIMSEKRRKRMSALMEYLPPVVRSYKMAYDIVAGSDNITDDFRELLNRFDPLYRAKLESLPVYSQKILCSLANADVPATLSELRVLTGLPAGILSTYLRHLAESGYIRKINPHKRGMPYEVKDSLFGQWLRPNFRMHINDSQ